MANEKPHLSMRLMIFLRVVSYYIFCQQITKAAALITQTFKPCILGAEHVGFAVADEVGFRAVDVEAGAGFVDEASGRFTAITDFAVCGQLGLGMMRAVVEGIEVGADFFEFYVHPVVDALDVAFGIEAAGNAALVCHEDGEIALVVDVFDGFFGSFYPNEVLGAVQVVDVDIQGTVAVEEDGLIFHIRSNRRYRGT